ncbi:alpha/beta hydrolase fold [Rubrobacter radiotolerans]|uniref:Alpha/beta hydrolase n=1 Tax=Rubrobacter radiotolerans TaxID=42256 RepID=A0A023X0G7_RUBRA|nr:alpha/beta hydrolase [Rubrobacter radiotolerans]AHY45838.1 alpha/beta hydrolase fold [Rubrobacter radiotolerans]MDX5893252.1 alpha/beta hydrolase [Rubrobacter radiotolerans]SMC03359.1 arylformamidase [Rubrobacter radiotolerans DSM 5868]
MLYRNFATQEELDAEYNLYNTVPDVEVYSRFYERESERLREILPKHRLNVPYGPTLAEHVDLYPASSEDDGPAPILVYVHGGYWRARTSREFGFVARGPASRGVATVSVNYALCPKVRLAEIVRQVRAAVAWVYRNAASFGGDPERLHLAGHSAGGHLVATTLTADWPGDYGLPENLVKSATAISGLFDLSPFPYTFIQPQLQLDWDEVRRYSPLFHVPENSGYAPPLLLAYGSEEPNEMKRQSEDFLTAWRKAGNAGERIVLEGKNHYDAIDGFLDAKSPLLQAVLRVMEV